jgi:hypothetical protein
MMTIKEETSSAVFETLYNSFTEKTNDFFGQLRLGKAYIAAGNKTGALECLQRLKAMNSELGELLALM